MKLRNKETGEVVEAESCNSATGMIGIFYENKDGKLGTKDCFETLAELNAEWEDYTPKQPLIKDKKIRKAVRAWAEANGEEDNIVFTRSCEYSDYMFYTNGGGDICFEKGIDLTTGSYTIAELCGEEEE